MSEQTPLSLDKHIQETDAVKITNTEPPQDSATGSASASSVEYAVKDCENLYGAAMETAHCLINTRKKEATHRGLPEERLKMQGKMLHNICTKYNIQIPTELEVIIFGGALVMDFQYMGAKEAEQETKTETPPKPEPAEEQPQEQEQKTEAIQ
jgi:hypothetical protein